MICIDSVCLLVCWRHGIQAIDKSWYKDRLEYSELRFPGQCAIPDQPTLLVCGFRYRCPMSESCFESFSHAIVAPKYFTCVVIGTSCPLLKNSLEVHVWGL